MGGAEVVVVDNASTSPVLLSKKLRNGMSVRVLRRDVNEGAAARNAGVAASQGDWIIMLDDDSYPLDTEHVNVLLNAPSDVAAIGAEITLPNGDRESGGLPEVFVGCGVAIQRDAFLATGGYDPAFDYYVEEYDLCAKLLLDGWRVIHDQRFRVRHEKVMQGRDMNRIVHRLVRNNGWVAQRYAPERFRQRELNETVSRYAQIAIREHAANGFALGMRDLLQSLDAQESRGMSAQLFDRFTGLTETGATLRHQVGNHVAASIVEEGKNGWIVRQVLKEMDVQLVSPTNASILVIGTLSPGPMLDAVDRWSAFACARGQKLITPWQPKGQTVAEAACT